MPIGAAALLLFRGGEGVPSQAPIARDDIGIDIAPGEFVDVSVLTNDDLFGEAVTNFEVLAASGVHPEILPGNILRLWGLTPPPEHTNEHVINVPADPNYSLQFPRPGLDPYLEVNDGAGGTKNAFPIDQDVTVIFDAATTYDPANFFTTWGGRHIRLIGGAIGGNGPRVAFTSNAGSVFIEGLSVDASVVESDVITPVNNPTIRSELGGDGLWPKFYLQHCALTGINGTVSTTHADAFQVQGSPSLVTHLQVEECSISTGYQGFFIPLNPATPLGVQSAVFRWVDFALFPANERANFIWMKSGSIPEQVYYPVDLYEVYGDQSTEPVNQPWHAFSFSPTTGAPAGHEAVLSGDGLSMTWPNSQGFITGMAKKGPSPFGNFAPRAGLGYVSPWGTP